MTAPAEGVGTVLLPVKRDPDMRGPQAHHLLRLTNVLYTPSAIVNIVGSPLFELAPDVRLESTPKSLGTLRDANDNPIAFFSPTARLYCLRLSGPPVGPRLAPTKFEPDVKYVIGVMWPDSERARWNARGQPDEAETETKPRQRAGEQPYTTEEKAWLRKYYRGEFKFLRLYGLSIYDEEERAEGRAIMRALASVSPDEDGDEDEDETEEREEEDDFAHVADYLFDEKELAWIKKHFQNSARFLFSHGLKFYDNEDCADAKRLIKSFMSDDE